MVFNGIQIEEPFSYVGDTPGVDCDVLACITGDIWETVVMPNGNGRSAGMQSCSPVGLPVLKSFHSVQVCWNGLGRMINGLVPVQLFGGQLEQKKTTGEISEGQSII